jgi:hypothetical protein
MEDDGLDDGLDAGSPRFRESSHHGSGRQGLNSQGSIVSLYFLPS